MENRKDTPTETVRGYARIISAQPVGASAALVTIEADITLGLHSFSIVGLPDKAMEESRDRISAAIRHTGFKSPKSTNRKIVLSLSPANLRKEGSHYDVPLALCYLAAAGEISLPETPMLFSGELALNGELRTVRGILPQVIAAKSAGIRTVFVPPGNVQEAVLCEDVVVYAPRTLTELVSHIQGEKHLKIERAGCVSQQKPIAIDLLDIKGQETAKRSLEIAAAGRHNLVLYGPPGTGKTMLARALPGILPPLTSTEILAVTAIHSTAGILQEGEVVSWPPFRSPHHTVSHTAMVGGGAFPRAGEVTLAHRGVLFLDEFPEFDARALEALRQPLEDKIITISRNKATFVFPADCMVVAALNPADTLTVSSRTAIRAADKQARKISRPIADRLDLWVEVAHISQEELCGLGTGDTSEEVRGRVENARTCMYRRNKDARTNSELTPHIIETDIHLTSDAKEILASASEKLQLSPRAYHRTIRVAQTIADLHNGAEITKENALEALQYRPRGIFGFE